MAVNKIKISANTRKVLNKTKEILGIQGENMKDVLFFALSEKIDGTAVVEIELPNGVQSFVELIKVEDGYELPVKSVLTEQAGFVKFQLRILQNKVEVFKSEIFELEVKESLNAIYEEPEEYPTWLDKLEDLQTELNNSEKERISNENERIESEEARKENFTQMQKSVKGAISNIKDLTENYNLNATEKTNKFDENYTEKKKAFDDNYSETLKSFNDNAETKYDNYNKNAENKTSEYNKNNDEKLKAYNDNHTTKITNFDTNAKNKTDEYNSNASKKLDDYNSNDTTKTEKYNENATTKLSDYNSNATDKKKEYDTNAENKIVEFNNNATEKLDEYNQNAESLTNRVIECESENERLRNDIKSIALPGEASGENIHLEDSSNARCEIEIGGNQKQETRSVKNLSKVEKISTVNGGYINASCGILATVEKGETYTISLNCSSKHSGTNVINVRTFVEDSYYVQTNLNYSSGNRISKTFVASNSGELSLSANLGTDYTDVLYDIQLEKGTSATDYEQYGASPSIDFPSELKAVGDDINILNDTIFARKGYYSGIVGATTQKVNTTIRLLTDEDINVISNKDITISLGTDKDLKYNFFEIDENDVIIKNNMQSNNKDKTIKLQENTKKISLMLMWQDANKTITLEDIKDCKIKIAYGTSINNYSFYNCGSAKVDIVNKNIFKEISNKKDIKKAYFNIIGGILNIKKGEICIISFDTNNNQGGLYLNEDIFLFQGNYSVTCDGKRHYLIGKAKDQINTNVTILKTNKETTNNYDISNVLVTKYDASNVDTKYIKHQEQSYLVDVQQPMFEGDTFVKQDAKWCEKHNWKTMSFDGQNVASQAGGTFADFKENGNIVRTFEIKDLLISSVRNDIFCDKLPRQADSMWNGRSTGIQSWQGQNKILISLPFDDVEKKYGQKLTVDNYVTAFYMYLQDEVLIISYPLAEPILLECTEAQSKVLDEIYNKAHTYKNITNISAESAEINPIVSLKYLKDVEIEHNKLQAQIDEIKQLLSTTQTSSLLLDNMQKDLESEV